VTAAIFTASKQSMSWMRCLAPASTCRPSRARYLSKYLPELNQIRCCGRAEGDYRTLVVAYAAISMSGFGFTCRSG
jgi:hypothetical protein